jgi:hypothetical protein
MAGVVAGKIGSICGERCGGRYEVRVFADKAPRHRAALGKAGYMDLGGVDEPLCVAEQFAAVHAVLKVNH